ncbi:MAG: DUF3696 domain-containing protein [Thermodesulfobacteriota bacterium]
MNTKLMLKNFKCFDELSVDLSPLTVLTGLNGMGKSTVIQAILLLWQSLKHAIENKPRIILNGDLAHLGSASSVFCEDANDDVFYIILYRKIKTYLKANYDAANGFINAKISPSASNYNAYLSDLKYINAERIGPKSFYNMSDDKTIESKQLGISGEYAIHYLHKFRDEKISSKKLAHPKEESLTLESQVNAWLSEISPGTSLRITAYDNMSLMNLEYSFATSTHRSKNFTSSHVGFGLTYALPVIVSILSAKPGSLIIVENPEAHIHPQGQSMIGQLISKAASDGIQIIVETHSDHLLNGVRVAAYHDLIPADDILFYFFTRKENTVGTRSTCKKIQIDSSGRITEWPIGFFDEWENNLEILIKPKK